MKYIFWNVDTQNDFMNKDGSLYVDGAEEIKPALKRLTELARENDDILVVNTGDYHTKEDVEISNEPDFVNTFPMHCEIGSSGCQYIEETMPICAFTLFGDKDVDGDVKIIASQIAIESKEVVLFKSVFDVFAGNHYADVFAGLSCEAHVVYGVAGNVCVDFVVKGLINAGRKVYVVSDAIKNIPNIPDQEENWKNMGVELKTVEEIEKMIENEN